MNDECSWCREGEKYIRVQRAREAAVVREAERIARAAAETA